MLIFLKITYLKFSSEIKFPPSPELYILQFHLLSNPMVIEKYYILYILLFQYFKQQKQTFDIETILSFFYKNSITPSHCKYFCTAYSYFKYTCAKCVNIANFFIQKCTPFVEYYNCRNIIKKYIKEYDSIGFHNLEQAETPFVDFFINQNL